MTKSIEPLTLEVFVGGYMGDSYGIRWEQGTLIYEHFSDGYEKKETVKLHPSTRKWKNFWTTLEKIGVWQWQELYEDQHVVDGTNWSVEIEIGGRSLSSGGSNAFPSAQNESRGQPPFDRFCHAVSLLADGRTFS